MRVWDIIINFDNSRVNSRDRGRAPGQKEISIISEMGVFTQTNLSSCYA